MLCRLLTGSLLTGTLLPGDKQNQPPSRMAAIQHVRNALAGNTFSQLAKPVKADSCGSFKARCLAFIAMLHDLATARIIQRQWLFRPDRNLLCITNAAQAA